MKGFSTFPPLRVLDPRTNEVRMTDNPVLLMRHFVMANGCDIDILPFNENVCRMASTLDHFESERFRSRPMIPTISQPALG